MIKSISGKEREIDIAYLQDCFNDESHSFYPEIDSDQSYSNFSSKKYRKGVDGWENLLLLEQNGRCCYCMRKLDNCARNIEHVVPRNINTENPEEEFQKYAKAASIIEDNVILASNFTKTKFEDSEDIRKAVKMPHRIALQNLLVSCNGKFGTPSSGCCCNNARSNDFLQPLMLMQDGANKVYYDGISGVVTNYPFEPSWGKCWKRSTMTLTRKYVFFGTKFGNIKMILTSMHLNHTKVEIESSS